MYGLRDVEENVGVTRDEVRTCMESAWTDRINAVGEEDADYTKCVLYDKCGLTVDWTQGSPSQCPTTTSSTSTTTTTSTTSTTTTTTTTTTPTTATTEAQLPDYNDDQYTFSCDDTTNQCTLTMSDGQTFLGTRDDNGFVTFLSIPFAQPPTGNRRWKAPELITQYDEVVDGTVAGWQCANKGTLNFPNNQGVSEDCLHIKVQVQENVLNKKLKKPIVAYIHGGGFNYGANDKDLTSLANQGLVTFDINYRLGPYGFLTLENTEEGQQFNGNWGLQDQLAGLKWISMFAGVFGGDKNQVTLDGCSAGSASAWFHLVSPPSWPYYHRMVTNGIGMSSGSYFRGPKTDLIRNTIFDYANVTSIDELRQLPLATLSSSFTQTESELTNTLKQSPTLDNMYGPSIDGELAEDLLIYLVRDGKIRPNTPIAFNYSKDDGWNSFTSEAFVYLAETHFSAFYNQIVADRVSTGFEMPYPWPHTMLESMYPPEGAQLKQVFKCEPDTDCREGFARWVMASHWYCNSRWALNGALKSNPENFGAIYPMQFGMPNCDKVDNANTKSCHCGEGAWIRGQKTWGKYKTLGTDMKRAFGQFYKTGSFGEDSQMKSWEEMNFNQFNMIGLDANGTTFWNQSAILDWAECDILDQIQERTKSGYTFGVKKYEP